MKWLSALVGSVLGAGVGLFGPALGQGLVMAVFDVGTGSYEEVLFIWFAAIPAGFVLGAWAGYRLVWRRGRRQRFLDAYSQPADKEPDK